MYIFDICVGQVNALIDSPGVNCVSFVGSSKIAELVTKRARALNKRVLALGGAKNHLVAARDCNIEMTSQDILNSFAGKCVPSQLAVLSHDLTLLIVSDRHNFSVYGGRLYIHIFVLYLQVVPVSGAWPRRCC